MQHAVHLGPSLAQWLQPRSLLARCRPTSHVIRAWFLAKTTPTCKQVGDPRAGARADASASISVSQLPNTQ